MSRSEDLTRLAGDGGDAASAVAPGGHEGGQRKTMTEDGGVERGRQEGPWHGLRGQVAAADLQVSVPGPLAVAVLGSNGP